MILFPSELFFGNMEGSLFRRPQTCLASVSKGTKYEGLILAKCQNQALRISLTENILSRLYVVGYQKNKL